MNKLIKETLHMKFIDDHRQIRIQLPGGYDSSDTKYPVIYMHDGQNVYGDADASFGTGWHAGSTLKQIEMASGQKYILVAIDNGPNRYAEYSNWGYEDKYPTITKARNFPISDKGQGAAYASFIVEVLKPHIDANYQTLPDKENTWIMGSSMGGLISLYTAFTYQHIFGKVGIISPAVWYAEESIIEFCGQIEVDLKVYMDIGTEETSGPDIVDFKWIYLEGAIRLARILEDKVSNPDDFLFHIADKQAHNEEAWSVRFPNILDWLSSN